MKKFLFLGFMFYCLVISAQYKNTYGIIAINNIPLTIQTKYHLDSFPSSGITSELYVLSDTIHIGLLDGQIGGAATNVYTIQPPFTKQQLQQIQFRQILVHFKDSTHQTWSNLLNYNKVQLEIKHVLGIDDQLILQFRFNGKRSIIQELRIQRIALYPHIVALRQKTLYDSVDANLKAQLMQNKRFLPKGFNVFSEKTVTVQPGNYLELLIGSSRMNKDSVIQYQLTDTSGKPYTNWILTGHYLSIPSLPRGKKSILRLQYLWTDKMIQYQINSLPFWYETSRFIYLILIMVLGLLLYVIYVFYKRRLKKKQAQLTQALERIATIQSKLNPHFVYNALSSIQGLIHGDYKDAASDYLARFSVMMRSTLNNSHQIFISLSEEIAMLDSYLSIEQLRFGFQFSIETDARIVTTHIQCPPMLLQPSVENAVKHGVARMRERGHIHVQLNKVGKGFEVLIQDNGKQPYPFSYQEGNGIKLTKDRIKHLQEMDAHYFIQYQIDVNDLGCLVRFYFEIMND